MEHLPFSARALRAAADLSRAKKLLADARRRLARATRPGHPSHVVDPTWKWALELMEARRAKLLAVPGVIGLGLGFRLRGGHPTGEPCLTVYVREKLSERELSRRALTVLPRFVRSGKRRLPVDVLALGKLRRTSAPGDSIGEPGTGQRGTLGALATDVAAGDTVAITAMHVTSLDEFPAGGSAAPSIVSPMPGGAVIGELRQGTRTGTDAAKIALAAQQPPVSTFPTIGTIKGWRPIAFPGDQGTLVKMFGAASGFQSGYVVNPLASIPEESLDAAILVNISTQGGDSGSALVDHEGLLLGFLVGQGGAQLQDLRVFTPASLVLARLGCDIPNS